MFVGVHVHVGDAFVDRAQEFRQLTRGDPLAGRADHVGRNDGAFYGPF
jgi:hypothetical protein